MGQLSLCSHMLLLPLGVPPTPVLANSVSESRRCLPPHLMGEMQCRARGFRITKCYPSVAPHAQAICHVFFVVCVCVCFVVCVCVCDA